MSVYVDKLVDYGWRLGPSCHMVADTLPELHAMAAAIGMKRNWFQGLPKHTVPHYDLVTSRRQRAVAAGAIEVDRFAFVAFMRRMRAQRAEGWGVPITTQESTQAEKHAVRRTEPNARRLVGEPSILPGSPRFTSIERRAFPRGGALVSTGAIAPEMQAERWSPSPKSRLQTNKRQEQRSLVLASSRSSGHPGSAARRSGLTPSAAPKPVESLLRRLSDAGSIPAASTTSKGTR